MLGDLTGNNTIYKENIWISNINYFSVENRGHVLYFSTVLISRQCRLV